jgi:flagellar basal body rod protein FlgG
MISLYRLYEANQRALQMQDRTVDVLVNKVAS